MTKAQQALNSLMIALQEEADTKDYNQDEYSVKPLDILEELSHVLTPYDFCDGIVELAVKWAVNCEEVGNQPLYEEWMRFAKKMKEVC